MKTLILGDIHGNWEAANQTIENACLKYPDINVIFQVGDLGDGWPGTDRWDPKVNNIPIHWVDGNHDNHDLIDYGDFNPRLIYQPRGSVLEIDGWRILFIGGATSIDRVHRTAHISWWPQESITNADVEKALNVKGPIHTVISHDRPNCFPFPDGTKILPDGNSDRLALEAIWEYHRPQFWFHGHYHWPQIGYYEGTEYYALPAIDNESTDYIVWDGISALHSWK